jgi:hypothetical protein
MKIAMKITIKLLYYLIQNVVEYIQSQFFSIPFRTTSWPLKFPSVYPILPHCANDCALQWHTP